jgi:hypothetical protein
MTTAAKPAYLDGLPVSELLGRGWTHGLIGKLLGKPDQLTTNPHHRSGPKMRLYARARVLQAEASSDLRAVQEDGQPENGSNKRLTRRVNALAAGLAGRPARFAGSIPVVRAKRA